MNFPILTEQSAQRGKEYHTWIALCLALGVKRYVELGCATGASATFALHSGIQKVVTIDTTALRPVGLSRDIPFISATSGDPRNIERVFHHLSGWTDAVFIDASHEAIDVRKDFDLWWPETKILLAFHDIQGFGVKQVWEDVSKEIRSVEIISKDRFSESEFFDNRNVQWGGIGVLFKENR